MTAKHARIAKLQALARRPGTKAEGRAAKAAIARVAQDDKGQQPLTSQGINDSPAPATQSRSIWDGGQGKVTGFGIRIFAPTRRHPKGARTFFLSYRVDGFERRVKIGGYPQWSVAAARAEAKALRQRVDKGEDPAAAKAERREAATVGDLIERYIAQHLPTKKNDAADKKSLGRARDEKRMLEEIGDALGRRKRVAEVNYNDIVAMHRHITETPSTSHHSKKRRPVRANRVLAIASKLFSMALIPAAGEDKPWRDAVLGNPCQRVPRNQEEARERFFSAAELAAISDALAKYPAQTAASCVRLITLSGCRPAEAMKAGWSEFDAEPGHWVKPSAHTKQRKLHRAPLSPPALELIDALRAKRKKGEAWVFPGQRSGQPIQQLWSVWHWVRDHATLSMWAASADPKVKKTAGEILKRPTPSVKAARALAAKIGVELPGGLDESRLYDLRHTFASVGAGGGLSLPIIGRLLGHTQSRTTQRYAHIGDDPLKEATAKIGAIITGAAKPGADVVPTR